MERHAHTHTHMGEQGNRKRQKTQGINWRHDHDRDKLVKQAVWHLGLNSCLEARYRILSSILRKDHSHVFAATDCL